MGELLIRLKSILLETEIAGNELWRIAALFLTVLIMLIVGKLVRYLLDRAAERDEQQGTSIKGITLRALSASFAVVAFVLGVRFGCYFLNMNEKITELVTTVNSVLFTIAVGWVLYCLVDIVSFWLAHMANRTRTKLDDMLVPLVRKSLRVTIVVLTLLQVATTLSDKPLTALLAGLGVSSVAIAFAAQDTVKNFFGSLMILADKPFELGDRIVVNGHDGPVEEVGFRSTRIRRLDGHLVTIPNGELANMSIENIGKRPYIKRVANITITYDTPPEKVQRAIDIIKEVLENHEGMRPDLPPRVYFNEFNDASLNILVIYWYHPPEYWDYLAFSERFNMEIFKRFGDEGIEFAFPTQTMYLAGDPARPLNVGITQVDG